MTELKPCRLKKTVMHVCMPPVGTVVFNPYLTPSIVAEIGKTTYISGDEVRKLSNERKSQLKYYLHEGLCAVTTKATPFVVAGPLGEFYVCGLDALLQRYALVEFNRQSFNLSVKRGQFGWKRIVPNTEGMLQAGFFDAGVYQDGYALYVGQQTAYQLPNGDIVPCNQPGVTHGKGDFVVFSVNKQYCKVVNGLLFSALYDNRGFEKQLIRTVEDITVEDLPNMLNTTSVKTKSVELAIIQALNEIWGENNVLIRIVPRSITSDPDVEYFAEQDYKVYGVRMQYQGSDVGGLVLCFDKTDTSRIVASSVVFETTPKTLDLRVTSVKAQHDIAEMLLRFYTEIAQQMVV